MSTATDMLALYLAAESAILAGQAFRWIDGRQLQRADLATVQAGRKEWEAKVSAEAANSAGRRGPRHLLANFNVAAG